jgi:hypothetical protein
MSMKLSLRLLFAGLFLSSALMAQVVSPVIVEYKEKAEGKLQLTNNTQMPLVVVLEAKSFSITPEGRGVYRPLDTNIHLQLSSTSTRLQPGQSFFVFYKAKGDALPGWFTIFSTFSQPRHEKGVDVRVMLPHTVYLYQKQKMQKSDIQIKEVTYVPETHKVVCDLENISANLGRVQSVIASGPHSEATSGGFPLLPGSPRHLEMEWKGAKPPKKIEFAFENFTLDHPVEMTHENTPDSGSPTR